MSPSTTSPSVSQCYVSIKQLDSPSPRQFQVGCLMIMSSHLQPFDVIAECNDRRRPGRLSPSVPRNQRIPEPAESATSTVTSTPQSRPTRDRAKFVTRARRKEPDGSPVQPLEPMLLPKLRIHFADFPWSHCSIDQRLFTSESGCGDRYGRFMLDRVCSGMCVTSRCHTHRESARDLRWGFRKASHQSAERRINDAPLSREREHAIRCVCRHNPD